MPQRFLPRLTAYPGLRVGRLKVLVPALLVALFLGFAFPPTAIIFMRPLSTNQTWHATMVSEGPARYHGEEVQARVKRTVVTHPGTSRRLVEVHASTTLLVDNEPAFTVDEVLPLTRTSVFPDVESEALLTTTFDNSNEEFVMQGMRTGLHYFLPFEPERRSYPYFDLLARDHRPLDYVDEIESRGLDGYRFYQRIEAIPLAYAADALRASMGAPDTAVPYYFVERTLDAEQRTGAILDESQHFTIVFANSAGEAMALVENPEQAPSDRIIADISLHYDEATLSAAHERAARDVTILRSLQVIAWLGKVTSSIVGALIVFEVMRYRRRRELAFGKPE